MRLTHELTLNYQVNYTSYPIDIFYKRNYKIAICQKEKLNS